MSGQLQCPSCGGYKVEEDDKSGCASKVIGHIILSVITYGIWIIVWVLIAIVESFKPKPDLTIHDFTCQICGYKWTWKEGTPYPKIRVQPELIAKFESQKWTCKRCNTVNDASRSSCAYCFAPKM